MGKRLGAFRTQWMTALLGLLFLSLPSMAGAALDGYASIVGETQGTIEGDVSVGPYVGAIRIQGFGSSVSADFDTDTGLPTGGQQHRPIRILKNVDPASPKLLNALVNNETLTTVTIDFIRPGSAGAEVHFFTVELLNAHVVSILPSHSSQADDANVAMNETISLTYQKMIITWEAGGVTGEANW